MMQRLVGLGSFAAIVLAAALPAASADLGPASRISALPHSTPSLPAWSGFYLGGHVGGAVRDWDSRVGFLAIDCSTCSLGETRSASFGGPSGDDLAAAGGIQAGYNWQLGSFLVGFEADGALVGGAETRNYTLGSAALRSAGLGAITDPPDGFSGQFRSEIDWMATARGRVGFTNGRFLVYATGGLAVADTETTANYLSLVTGPTRIEPVSARDDSIELGWAIGVGVEAAITADLSAKMEYLYADFGHSNRQLGLYINDPTSLQQFVSLKEDLTLHTFRLGLNYRFGH